MRSNKLMSLILALCIAVCIVPSSAFADTVTTHTMEIVVNEGESISVWNTDIAEDGVISNKITVLTEDGSDYDIVFPENADTAAAVVRRSDGLEWETADYIKPDRDENSGMLVLIGVNTGKALLRIESKTDSVSENVLKPYTEDILPLAYSVVESGQSAEYMLPEKCSLSNISLVMCGTNNSEIKRTINTDTNSYEIYRFLPDFLRCYTYTNGNLDKVMSVPRDIMIGTERGVYNCTAVLFPCGAGQRNLGVMKTTEGNVILAVPQIHAPLEENMTAWSASPQTISYGSVSEYEPLYDRFYDTNKKKLLTVPTDENIVSESQNLSELKYEGSICVIEQGDSFNRSLNELSRENLSATRIVNPHEGTDENPMMIPEYSNKALDEKIKEIMNERLPMHSVEYTSEILNGSLSSNEQISDSDMAKEMTGYSKNHVLLQAATSILQNTSDNQTNTAVLSGKPGSNNINTSLSSMDNSGNQNGVAVSEVNDNSQTTEPSGGADPSGEEGGNGVLVYSGSGYAVPEICSIYTSGGQADRATAVEGDTVSLSASVPNGKRFVAWHSCPDISFNKSAPVTSAVIPGDTETVYFYAEYVPIEYGITVNSGAGGNVLAGKAAATVGKKVVLSVTPDTGYELSSLNAYADGDIAVTQSESDPNSYSFIMPAKAVTVYASFEKIQYAVETSGSYCTLSTDKAYAGIGDTVTLTVSSSYTHRHLASLTVLSGDAYLDTEKTGENTYTFTMPTGNVTANAVYAANAIVLFRNWNGLLLTIDEYNVGETPAYTGETPVRAPDAMNTYTFAGWDKTIVPVGVNDEEVTYTAVFTPTLKSYTVYFIGADGNSLQTSSVPYGETPEYTGQTPVMAADDYFVYTFAGWYPEIAPVNGDTVYIPMFSAVTLLGERRNIFELEIYREVTSVFTPEKSGWYRFWTAGDEVMPSWRLVDENGDLVEVQNYNYNTDEKFNMEFVVLLEGGKTYDMSLEAIHSSGNISLYIENVDMHTVTIDQNIEHGTLEGEDPVSYLAYTGQIIYPWPTPDPGYGLLETVVTDENGKRLMKDGVGYVMPDSDVFATAVFAPTRAISIGGISEGIDFSNNEVVIIDNSGEEPVDYAAVGAGVEYTFEWDNGYILDEFSIKTQSGEDVPYGKLTPYINRMTVWFTMPDEAIAITAKIAEAKTLTLSPGEIGGTALNVVVESGSELALPESIFSAPRNKTFAGWSASEADPAEYAPGDTLTMSDDVTLYAVWEPKSHTETAVTKNAESVVAEVSLNNITGKATVIAATYQNGRLISSYLRETEQNSETFTLTGAPDTLKVFVFEDMNSLEPLTDVEEFDLK